MSIAWKNAPTKAVDVGGTKLVYRQLGPDTGVPVIFLNHLAAELDRWDPRVVDGIATRRRGAACRTPSSSSMRMPGMGVSSSTTRRS
jgi:pimeloyl-ACP methyl ester carboxylesterase